MQSGSQYCAVTANLTCVTDGIGAHGNNEACTFVANVDLMASAAFFHTESWYDYVTIGGTRYSGLAGPTGVVMTAGSTAASGPSRSLPRS